ncbi:MAG: hypothetical protein R2751_03285 [Bacteroidales bacterium]
MNAFAYPTDQASLNLYKAGGWTTVLFLLYSMAALLLLAFLPGGYPETATECFDMIRENRFLAFLQLDILSVVAIPFYFLLFFSLCQALKTRHALTAQIALFCTLAGITVFIADVNIVSILRLADNYELTDSPERKQQLLAACEGMLASDMWINSGAILRGIFIETGALLFSVLMLKTSVFSRATGLVGILTHGFDLASVLAGVFYAPVKEVFTMTAGPLYLVWFAMVGLRLFALGKKRSPR